MSCNGCRVLRKGCSDTCILRPCLLWIKSPEAQGHATVFVAKFFGRAGLMGFINNVPENQRSALFQSLLYEACGRTVNPVYGAVGLLWSGNWHICQAAVDTVLKGGTLRAAASLPTNTNALQCAGGMPITSFQTSNPAVVPEGTVLTLSSEQPSTTVLCTDASKPKRRSDDDQKDRDNHFVQDKRCRSIEQENNSRAIGGCFINQVSGLRTSKARFVYDTSNNVEHNELKRREQCQQPSGQLVTPLPVRARQCMSEIETTASLRYVTALQQQSMVRSDNIDLDLSLNIYFKNPNRRVSLEDTRISSPNSVTSVNSEGSLTSLDTADMPISPWPRKPPSPKEEHKLLDLLL